MESMGLAAPRRKVKYDIDPRNNAWANDDDKFGQKMLEKFGWTKGKGLGAAEDGKVDNIKVKVKNNKLGIGSNLDYSDTWLDHQDDFNSLLANLNTSHSGPSSGTATPKEDETDMGSMEERSKTSKARVHYKKFTRGKDLKRAKEEDLDALFGRRKNYEKRTKKKAKVASMAPMASTVANIETTTNTSVGPSALVASAAADAEEADKEFDAQGNLRTVTSNLSVAEYFAKKMAEIKAKQNGTDNPVSQFCDNVSTLMNSSVREEAGQEQTEELPTKEQSTKEPKEQLEEQPEVFAQEKFQKSTLTVADYFAKKMAEKKKKEAALSKVSDGNNNESEKDENILLKSKEKRKKKKRKIKVVENGNKEEEKISLINRSNDIGKDSSQPSKDKTKKKKKVKSDKVSDKQVPEQGQILQGQGQVLQEQGQGQIPQGLVIHPFISAKKNETAIKDEDSGMNKTRDTKKKKKRTLTNPTLDIVTKNSSAEEILPTQNLLSGEITKEKILPKKKKKKKCDQTEILPKKKQRDQTEAPKKEKEES